jgi:hypothetical protein
VGWPGHEWPDRPGQPVLRQAPEHQVGVLGRIGVRGAAPEGDSQRLTDRVAGALVIGMRVRQRQGRDGSRRTWRMMRRAA